MKKNHLFLALSSLLTIQLLVMASWADDDPEVDWAAGRFAGTREEVQELMAFHRTIELTAAQEAVRQAALRPIPAPCCSNFTAATCCCECNLARAIWGLAKYLIVERHAGAEAVRDAVEAWIETVNPRGYSGRACFNGGCNRPFARDGCGAMVEDALKF